MEKSVLECVMIHVDDYVSELYCHVVSFVGKHRVSGSILVLLGRYADVKME